MATGRSKQQQEQIVSWGRPEISRRSDLKLCSLGPDSANSFRNLPHRSVFDRCSSDGGEGGRRRAENCCRQSARGGAVGELCDGSFFQRGEESFIVDDGQHKGMVGCSSVSRRRCGALSACQCMASQHPITVHASAKPRPAWFACSLVTTSVCRNPLLVPTAMVAPSK